MSGNQNYLDDHRKVLNNDFIELLESNYFFIDLLKPNSSESLNRRSWDSSKLKTQIEEESTESLEIPKDDVNNIVIKINKSPMFNRKEEKDGMFSKFKQLRKGTMFYYTRV